MGTAGAVDAAGSADASAGSGGSGGDASVDAAGGSGGQGGTPPTCPADAGGGSGGAPSTSPTIGYRADKGGVTELFSVEIASGVGTTPVRVNRSLASTGDVTDFKWSPDGTKIAYLADHDVDNLYELHLVSMAGGPQPAVKLSAPMITGEAITEFAFAPDSSGLAYLVDTGLPRDLYYVRFCSGAAPLPATVLRAPATSAAFVWTFGFSPDSRRIAFSGDTLAGDRNEIFVVDLGGPSPGPAVRVHPALISPQQTYNDWQWSADSQYLLYRSQHGSTVRDQLYLTNVTNNPAGPTVRLNPTTGGNVTSNPTFLPDGSGVVFPMVETMLVTGLYLRRMNGATLGALVELNDPVMTSPMTTFLVGGDSASVAFTEPRAVPSDTVRELFFSDFSGAAPAPAVMINGAMVTGGDVASYGLSPNAAWLHYIADERADGTNELFISNVAGASPAGAVRLNPDLPSGGNVSVVGYRPSSSGLVYLADQVTNGRTELWWVALGAAPSAPLRVNNALTTTGAINGFGWRSDASALFYYGVEPSAATARLYFVPFTTGPGAPVPLSAAPGEGAVVSAAWRP
jgi:hypothetical protein